MSFSKAFSLCQTPETESNLLSHKDIVDKIIPFLIKEIADKGIRLPKSIIPDSKIRVDKNQIIGLSQPLLNAIRQCQPAEN
jgi:hypothetical protein